MTQVWTCVVVLMVATGQVVVVQLLPAAAAEAVQVVTGTFVVLFEVQFVDVQLFAAAAAVFTHVCAPAGPTTICAGQVVVVQLFPALPAAAVHVCVGVLLTVSSGQVVEVQLLPAVAAADVHRAGSIGVGPVVTGAGQVVAVQPLAAVPADTAQDRTGTLAKLFGVQVVLVQLLPAAAAAATQFCAPAGPVVTGAGQVVVVQALPPFGADAVQVRTGTLF